MNDFKKRVLDLAISQINTSTDLTVTYEQHKRGRVITSFTFRFQVKENAVAELVEPSVPVKHSLEVQVLSGLEKSMLKELQKLDKYLNEEEIIKMSKKQKLLPFDVIKNLQAQLSTAQKK